MEYLPYLPTDPQTYYRVIKWLYAHTLARMWWTYSRISLRSRRVINLGGDLEAFRLFWSMVRKGELDDNCSVHMSGILSEYPPLVPGAISPVDPKDWEQIIDSNVSKLLKEIHAKFISAGSSVSRKFYGEFDPFKAPEPEGSNEHFMKNYFSLWSRVLIKYGLFTGADRKKIIKNFGGLVNKDVANAISQLSAPHGVIRCPTLPNLSDYRYLGFSYEIADYGIPVLINKNVYESHLSKMMENHMCNAELVIHLIFIPEFPIPLSVQDIRNTITAFTPAKLVGVIENDDQIRSVKNPGSLKGRIWASYLCNTDDQGFTIHLPWRTQLNAKAIEHCASDIETFVEAFERINGFESHQLIASFDEVHNWFYMNPSISLDDNGILELAEAMSKNLR